MLFALLTEIVNRDGLPQGRVLTVAFAVMTIIAFASVFYWRARWRKLVREIEGR